MKILLGDFSDKVGREDIFKPTIGNEVCTKLVMIVGLGWLVSYFELKKHKPWFDEECQKLLDQRKRAKLQWLQDPMKISEDNLKYLRREARRYFRNKKKEYLKDKINELEMNSKNKNIKDLYRGINGFKRGYQPRNNLVKDENGDLLADSHNF
jgi:hypothetical protein